MGDGAGLAAADNQLQGLSRLQQRIAQAGPGSLASIRAEVTAYVAAAQVITNQALASAATAQSAEVALHAASETARREVTSFVDDFYGKKIFDPYLRFGSAEDEEAYRKREAERERAIKEALALGTPEGTLRAVELSKDQMRDAKDHGADRSAEYAPRWNSLETSERELTAATATTKTASRSDAPTVDPLDAVEPTANIAPDLIAAFKRTGVVVADQSQEGHGVAVRDASPQKRGLS
ncbi:hypothetical protein [Phenylobacterium sp.]|uniref:hypothetical protein n=1 Tax=Phenylobacterium sp. TaxID=1871053 RepID=UPI00271F7048|nr:hypothetical protein [Phenylobacterium sp.]MDO8381026.1 hypothetical protein [Phenylobacterium sp.]